MKKLKTTNSPSVILKLKNIKPNSKITLFNIAHCIKLKWTLSQGLLAEMGGMSERTINRCLNELEENGYIKRDTKLFNGKGKETSYTIIWDSITKYAKEYEWYDDKNSNTADLSPSNDEEVEQSQPTVNNTTEAIKIATEEFITDEDKYGIDVVDLIDENPEIINALNVVVEYRCGDHSKLMEAQGANSKIDSIVKSKSHDANFINRVERFCADYIKQYTEYVINNVKVKQIA